jgi:hypothetical protein
MENSIEQSLGAVGLLSFSRRDPGPEVLAQEGQTTHTKGPSPLILRRPDIVAFLDDRPSPGISVDALALLKLVAQLGIEGWRWLEPALRRDYRRHLAKDFVKLGVDTSNIRTDDDFYRLADAYFAAAPTIKQKALQASPPRAKEPTTAAMQQAQRAALKDIASKLKLPIVWVDPSPSTAESSKKQEIENNVTGLIDAAKRPLPNGQNFPISNPNFNGVFKLPAPVAKVPTPKPATPTPKPATPKPQATGSTALPVARIQLLLDSLRDNKLGKFSTDAGFVKAQGAYKQIMKLWPKMTTAERLQIVDLACHPRSQKLADHWNALLSKPSSSEVRKQQNDVLNNMAKVDAFRKSVGAAPSFPQVGVLRKQVAQSVPARAANIPVTPTVKPADGRSIPKTTNNVNVPGITVQHTSAQQARPNEANQPKATFNLPPLPPEVQKALEKQLDKLSTILHKEAYQAYQNAQLGGAGLGGVGAGLSWPDFLEKWLKGQSTRILPSGPAWNFGFSDPQNNQLSAWLVGKWRELEKTHPKEAQAIATEHPKKGADGVSKLVIAALLLRDLHAKAEGKVANLNAPLTPKELREAQGVLQAQSSIPTSGDAASGLPATVTAPVGDSVPKNTIRDQAVDPGNNAANSVKASTAKLGEANSLADLPRVLARQEFDPTKGQMVNRYLDVSDKAGFNATDRSLLNKVFSDPGQKARFLAGDASLPRTELRLRTRLLSQVADISHKDAAGSVKFGLKLVDDKIADVRSMADLSQVNIGRAGADPVRFDLTKLTDNQRNTLQQLARDPVRWEAFSQGKFGSQGEAWLHNDLTNQMLKAQNQRPGYELRVISMRSPKNPAQFTSYVTEVFNPRIQTPAEIQTTFLRLLDQNPVYGQVGAKNAVDVASFSHGDRGYVFRTKSLEGNSAFATGVVDDKGNGLGYVGGISAPANLDGGVKGAGSALMVDLANVMKERGFKKLEAYAFDFGSKAANPSAGTLWNPLNADGRFTDSNLPNDRWVLDHLFNPYNTSTQADAAPSRKTGFYPSLPFREGQNQWRLDEEAPRPESMQTMSNGQFALPHPGFKIVKDLVLQEPHPNFSKPTRTTEKPPQVPGRLPPGP